jgi:hypothetical protein
MSPATLAQAPYLSVIRLARWLGVKAPPRQGGERLRDYRTRVRGLVWQATVRARLADVDDATERFGMSPSLDPRK